MNGPLNCCILAKIVVICVHDVSGIILSSNGKTEVMQIGTPTSLSMTTVIRKVNNTYDEPTRQGRKYG